MNKKNGFQWIRLAQYFVLFVLTISCKGQKFEINVIEQDPNYLLISEIYLGEATYYDDEDDSNAGYRYRIITTTSEIYNSIFIEKLIIDIEDSPVKLAYSFKLDFNDVHEYFKLHKETDIVTFRRWLKPDTFTLGVGKLDFDIVIGESKDGTPNLVTLKSKNNG